MKVYQIIKSKWSGDEYERSEEKPLKTFLHEKAADSYKEFKNNTNKFDPESKYTNISYYTRTIEVCEDKDFKEPSLSEFLKKKNGDEGYEY